jgi:hypothetical protein
MIFQNDVTDLLDLVWLGFAARTLDVDLLNNALLAVKVMAAADTLIETEVQ